MYIEFNIPDLSEAAEGVPQFWLEVLFIGSPSNRYQINALTKTYVRLVEAALIEYQYGAAKLREFWGTHDSINLRAMNRSISQFETCISNMYRATKCFTRLRRDRGQVPLSRELSLEKAKFATNTVSDKLRAIRNEIQHLERMLLGDHIAEDQPIALKPDGPEVVHPTEPNQTIKTIDRLVVGTREVRFTELADWLTEMLRFAKKIADFLPNSRKGERRNAS